MVVDNRTGYIVGLKGGVGEKTVHDAYNRAKARLQTGSSIKPLSVYAPAFEAEIISPASAVRDMPLEIKTCLFLGDAVYHPGLVYEESVQQQ